MDIVCSIIITRVCQMFMIVTDRAAHRDLKSLKPQLEKITMEVTLGYIEISLLKEVLRKSRHFF